jgi:very-short-patch-repair endonuclease
LWKIYSPDYATLVDLSTPEAQRGKSQFFLPLFTACGREGGRAKQDRVSNLCILLTHYFDTKAKFLYFDVQPITELCRELRQRQTPAEKVLWYHLRNRKLFKHKFLRQYPICVKSTFDKDLYYIPDFYCAKAKLVIEADGPIHLLKTEYDKNRDEVLKLLGLRILRFENKQILGDIQSVLKEISKHL